MSCKIPLFAWERGTIGHPGACKFKFFTIHILPLLWCKCKICMRCSNEAYVCLIRSKFKCHMHSGNLSGCFKHIFIALTTGNCHSLFHIILFGCIDNCICAHSHGKIQAFLTNIKYDNLLGTKDLCPLHCEYANCSTS